MRLFGYGKGLVFDTDLDTDQVTNRLRTFADEESRFLWMATSSGSREVVCKIDGGKFRLWRRRRHVNNGFRPFFYGEFHKNGTTTITGQFRMDPFTRTTGKILFGFGVAFSGLFYAETIIYRDRLPLDVYMFFPILWFLGLAVIQQFGIWLGQSDVKVLTDFILNRLEARPIVASTRSQQRVKGSVTNTPY